MEGQIKCFQNKVKLKEFIIMKSFLYEMLKELKKKKIKNYEQLKDKLTTINNWPKKQKQKLSSQLE